MIKSLPGRLPKIEASVFVAESSDIIGNVKIAKESSVWYQTVLRGDVMPISIGERTNIQDGTIIHGTYQIAETKIGNNVTIGHKCVLHGCEIEDLCLIGMGSIIMDNVTVKKGSFVAAGSLLPPGKVYESGMMIMGSPAKVVRPLNEKEKQFLQQSANNYLKYLEWYQV